jgi:hypothetical protein
VVEFARDDDAAICHLFWSDETTIPLSDDEVVEMVEALKTGQEAQIRARYPRRISERCTATETKKFKPPVLWWALIGAVVGFMMVIFGGHR